MARSGEAARLLIAEIEFDSVHNQQKSRHQQLERMPDISRPLVAFQYGIQIRAVRHAPDNASHARNSCSITPVLYKYPWNILSMSKWLKYTLVTSRSSKSLLVLTAFSPSTRHVASPPSWRGVSP